MNGKKEIEFGSGQYICPRCSYEIKYVDRGVPCTQNECPKCGSAMMGELCHGNDQIGSVRMMKFRCRDCGFPMVLSERPGSCVKCGGSNIIREGWKQFPERKEESRSNERKGGNEHESRCAES